MGDESLAEPPKRATGIDRWFVGFLIVAAVLLLIEAFLMLLICKSLLMYLFYWALAVVTGDLARYYAKERR